MRKIFSVIAAGLLALPGFAGEPAVSFTVKSLLDFSSRFLESIGPKAPETTQFLTALSAMVMMSPQMATVDPGKPWTLILCPKGKRGLELMFAVSGKQGTPGLVEFGRERLQPFAMGNGRYLLAESRAAAVPVLKQPFFTPDPVNGADLLIRAANRPMYTRIAAANAEIYLAESAKRCGGIWGKLIASAASMGTTSVIQSVDRISWDLTLPGQNGSCKGDMLLNFVPGTAGKRYMLASKVAQPEKLSVMASPDIVCSGSAAVTAEFLAVYRNFLETLAGKMTDPQEKELVRSLIPMLSDLTGAFCISSYPGEGALLSIGMKRVPSRFAGKTIIPGKAVQIENHTWFLARNSEVLIFSARTKNPQRIEMILSTAAPSPLLNPGQDLVSVFLFQNGQVQKFFSAEKDAKSDLRIRTFVPEELFIRSLIPVEKELTTAFFQPQKDLLPEKIQHPYVVMAALEKK